jgi:hypothetical protein
MNSICERATARNIPTSLTLASSVALRVRHLAGHLHALGPRATYEWACEVIGGADPLAGLGRYATLDPEIVRALGADVLMPPLTVLSGGRS